MATVYINNVTGDDTTGDGTYNNPWENVSHASNNTSSGDTIVFQNSGSVYNYGSYVPRIANRIWEGELDSNDEVVVELECGETWTSAITIDNPHTVKNLILSKMNSSSLKLQNTSQQGLYTLSANITITFENVIVKDWYCGNSQNRADRGSVFFVGTGLNCAFNFTRCVFRNLGRASGSNRQFLIAANTGEFTVNYTNCTIDMTPPSGTNAWSQFIASQSSSGTKVVTFRNSVVYGDFTNTCEFIDNTVTDDMNYADNIVHEAGSGGFSAITIGNCITSDPDFVDSANGDYTYNTGSPALGAGDISI